MYKVIYSPKATLLRLSLKMAAADNEYRFVFSCHSVDYLKKFQIELGYGKINSTGKRSHYKCRSYKKYPRCPVRASAHFQIGQKTYFCKHMVLVQARYCGRVLPDRLNQKRKRGRPEKVGGALSRK